MKVKVKDIEANPYRKIEHYPIDKAKVEALKTSIQEKTFWDNILLREKGGKYELAYGHHRWMALLELGIKEIDVPVRDIDDATMLRIMAEENLNWSTSPKVTTQTVLAAKEFLDAELVKYRVWPTSDRFIRGLFGNQRAFETAKGMGVGRDTILKFLGGNWKAWMVQEALKILKDKDLDQEAAQSIPTMEQAKVFRSAVKEHQIPKPTQKRIAKKIVKEGVGKRDIPDLVAEHALPSLRKEKAGPKPLPMLDDYVRNTANKAAQLCTDLRRIKKGIENIQSVHVANLLRSRLKDLAAIMDDILPLLETDNEKTKRANIV